MYPVIPSDQLQPPTSILKKLAVHDPLAPEFILKRSEEVAASRRAVEMEMLRAKKSCGYRILVHGLRSTFEVSGRKDAAPRAPRLDDVQILNYISAQDGNDVRMALRDYCRINPEVMAKAGLTAEEHRALAPIKIAGAPLQEHLSRSENEGRRAYFSEFGLA